jgi:hypothetical protein
MSISKQTSFIFYIIIFILCAFIHTHVECIQTTLKAQKQGPKFPKSYLLPEEDPLHHKLKDLFQDPFMFESPKDLKKAGFKIKVNRNSHCMVASHPSLPNHLIKKFYDDISQRHQLKNFIRRIKGAQTLRKYIKDHHFNHLIVPKKWLYQLPDSFAEDFSFPSYALIVEKMDIYDDWDDPNGKARELYYHMDKEVLRELCVLLHDLGGCDSLPRNQPFTRTGKIAFVDTEDVGKLKDHFLKFTVRALNPELQTYAIDLWQKLEEQATIEKCTTDIQNPPLEKVLIN